MKKLNCILLIDDDPITIFLNKHLLTKLNIAEKILTASHGEEGLIKILNYCEEYDKQCPEVIFLDLNMPVMDGFDFIEEFKKLPIVNKKDSKIAVLTTSSNQTDLERIFDLGIKSYVVKPLTEDSVMALLTKS